MLYLDGEPVISVSFASTIVQKKVQRTNLEKKLVNERLLKSFFIKRLCLDKEERGDGGGGGGCGEIKRPPDPAILSRLSRRSALGPFYVLKNAFLCH